MLQCQMEWPYESRRVASGTTVRAAAYKPATHQGSDAAASKLF
jgi:hypothetical protein